MNIERKKIGNNFFYEKNGKKIINENTLERIKHLVIPPAWEGVKIADNRNSKIQCIGFDSKGRKQYKYHNNYIKKQMKKKYNHTLLLFGENIEKIRYDIAALLRKRVWNLDKVVAFIIYIIDNSNIRIGNEKYKEDNSSYGITTLEKKHINIKTTSIYFNFVGKKGVDANYRLTNSRIIPLFHSIYNEFKPDENESFFKYYGTNNKIYSVSSKQVNDFLKKYGNISAKTFRTWTANRNILKYIEELLDEKTKNKININNMSEKQLAILINNGVDKVAKDLNNTRAICKKSYISGDIIEEIRDNPGIFLHNIKKLKEKCNNHYGMVLINLLKEKQ